MLPRFLAKKELRVSMRCLPRGGAALAPVAGCGRMCGFVSWRKTGCAAAPALGLRSSAAKYLSLGGRKVAKKKAAKKATKAVAEKAPRKKGAKKAAKKVAKRKSACRM
jgi:hypothetical protein